MSGSLVSRAVDGRVQREGQVPLRFPTPPDPPLVRTPPSVASISTCLASVDVSGKDSPVTQLRLSVRTDRDFFSRKTRTLGRGPLYRYSFALSRG